MDCPGEGKDQKELCAECQRGGSMDRYMMGKEGLKLLCVLSGMRKQQERSQTKQNQKTTVSADNVQHTYA